MKKYMMTMAVAMMFLVIGCNRVEPDEVLLPREDISLTIKGKEHISFDSESFQLGFNEKSCEFRVVDDKLGHWFVLKCSEMPVESGQELTCTLEYTTDTAPKKHDRLPFSVQKVSIEDGKLWLWNDTRQIGVVVKRL